MEISVINRQRGIAVNLRVLRKFAPGALAACLAEPGGPAAAVLRQLEEVAVVLVSDRVSAKLHEKFLRAPGPTDVITFAHGEIVIGCGVALAQAREHGQSLTEELCRYLMHGLLHLHGYEDGEPNARAQMWQVQERLLRNAARTVEAQGRL